jgi:hypothetical protein
MVTAQEMQYQMNQSNSSKTKEEPNVVDMTNKQLHNLYDQHDRNGETPSDALNQEIIVRWMLLYESGEIPEP